MHDDCSKGEWQFSHSCMGSAAIYLPRGDVEMAIYPHCCCKTSLQEKATRIYTLVAFLLVLVTGML